MRIYPKLTGENRRKLEDAIKGMEPSTRFYVRCALEDIAELRERAQKAEALAEKLGRMLDESGQED